MNSSEITIVMNEGPAVEAVAVPDASSANALTADIIADAEATKAAAAEPNSFFFIYISPSCR